MVRATPMRAMRFTILLIQFACRLLQQDRLRHLPGEHQQLLKLLRGELAESVLLRERGARQPRVHIGRAALGPISGAAQVAASSLARISMSMTSSGATPWAAARAASLRA